MDHALVCATHLIQTRERFRQECESMILIEGVVYILYLILRYGGIEIYGCRNSTVPAAGSGSQAYRGIEALLKRAQRCGSFLYLLMLEQYGSLTLGILAMRSDAADMNLRVQQ